MNHFRTYCGAHSSNATFCLSFPNKVFKNISIAYVQGMLLGWVKQSLFPQTI